MINLPETNIFNKLNGIKHFIVFSHMKNDINKLRVKNDISEFCSANSFENIYLITDPSRFSQELRKPNVLFIFIMPIIPKEIEVLTFVNKTFQTSMIFISDTPSYKSMVNSDIILLDEKNINIPNKRNQYILKDGKLQS